MNNRAIPVPTYTGEYRPIPDTGIGLTPTFIHYVRRDYHYKSCQRIRGFAFMRYINPRLID